MSEVEHGSFKFTMPKDGSPVEVSFTDFLDSLSDEGVKEFVMTAFELLAKRWDSTVGEVVSDCVLDLAKAYTDVYYDRRRN